MKQKTDFLSEILYQSAILEEVVCAMRLAVDDFCAELNASKRILKSSSLPTNLAKSDAYYVFCVVLRELERISKDLNAAAQEADEENLKRFSQTVRE